MNPTDPALSDPIVRRSNPLLPASMQLSVAALSRGASGQFDWARERLRVLSADTPGDVVREYESLQRAQKPAWTQAQRYGLALARLRNGGAAEADATLPSCWRDHPDNLWVALALGRGRIAAPASRPRPTRASRRCCASTRATARWR